MEQRDQEKRGDTGPLGPSTTVRASPRQVSTTVGDDAVILGAQAGQYFGLNDVGARVWELVQRPVRVDAICAQLCAEYEVEPATCERDVLELLTDLRGRGLLDVQPESGAP